MQRSVIQTVFSCALIGGLTLAANSARAADPPSIKLALSFKPTQKEVDIDTPKADEQEKCTVKVERVGKASGWVVYGPAGQVLRRFVDTDGDNVVDQWKYYKQGIEVYRDLDVNNNNKVDQARWLNTGGTRWGLDPNEDGKIDSWKILSAEEASREAVRAMVDGDDKALGALLISNDDLKTLGISKEYSEKLLESVSDPGKKMEQIASKSKMLGARTVWMRFDNSLPCIIPADEGKADSDLVLYENGMAIIESDGKPGLVQIGEMVRVGDVWKLTQIPQPIEGNSVQVAVGGILLMPSAAGTATVADSDVPGINPETQKLLEQLQELDKNAPAPTAGATAIAKYNAQRADIMADLVEAAKSDEEKTQWKRQLVDGLAAAVQFGAYPEGLKRLKTLEADTKKDSPKSPILPYVTYRRMLAEYYTESQSAAGEKQAEVQEWWRKELDKFVSEFGDSEDAPEALLQLAIAQEFNGKPTDAKGTYQKLVKEHADSQPGRRATGALRRLELKGKKFELAGSGLNGGTINVQGLRGKIVLVVYWSTWCTPCTQDLPVLRALYEQYHDRGFEIVGVNLDTTPEPVGPYLKEHKVPWPQIYEPGGLESAPATSLGIIVPPVMYLLDREGVVLNQVFNVDDLKGALGELIKKK